MDANLRLHPQGAVPTTTPSRRRYQTMRRRIIP
jgi:hypothetical protein